MAHPYRATLAALGAATLLLAAPSPALAVSNSGSDTRAVPSRVLSPSSPFYQKLPTSTPTASDSSALVSSLNAQAHKYWGTPTQANITVNTDKFSTPLYVARKSDPVHNITAWNCQSHTSSIAVYLNAHLKNVHIPNDLQPDPSSDGSVSIYNPDTNEIVELWRARKNGGKWEACWGGKITNASQSLGRFDGTFGASASGMALWATTIRQQELLNGRIDHVVSMAIPQIKKGAVSWPAVRTDGWVDGTQLTMGQMLRLPASLNIDAMKLSPAAKTIAKAAQQYGIIVTETSGAVGFNAENPIALASNKYPSIFRGRWSTQEMAGDKTKGEVSFPLDKLVALPVNYRAPVGANAPSPTPPTTPAPTTPAPTTPAPSTPPSGSTSYSASVKASDPWLYWRLSDTGSTATDSSGKGRNGTFSNITPGASGAISGNAAVSARGTWNSLASSSTSTTPATSFSVQLWFKTTSKSGGKLAGLEDTRTGVGSRYDRMLYLTNSGSLVFGTYSGKTSTLTSPRTYNDGAWHMVTATQGRGGSRLYVDGALVASNGQTQAQPGAGYWRLGGGNLGGWPSAPSSSFIQASIDEFAVYYSALSASTIASQYKAR